MSTNSVPTNLLDVLLAAPAANTAVVLPDADLRLTYDELRGRILGLAGGLRAAGIARGDRVAMAFPNGLPAIVSFLGASFAGTAAPLNPGYREEEFRFYLADTNARILLAPPGGAEEARRAAAARGVPVLDVEESGRLVSAAGSGDFAPVPDDIALVLHTSGSTGRPKRVPLRHGNLAVSIRNIASTYRLGEADVSLCLMPLFHVHGLMASTMATLYTGGTVVTPSKFNPLAFWRLLRDHDVTWYSAVPTIHQLILARKGGRIEAALRSLVQRVALAGTDGEDGGPFRSAGARGLWHDGGVAPDVLEPAAAGGAQAGLGGSGHGRAHRHSGRARQRGAGGRSWARSASRVPT